MTPWLSWLPQGSAESAVIRPFIKTSAYWKHTPTPKQLAFLWLDCEEAFYGGAAGGGKSDALLMAALQYVDVPGYNALLLRRTFKALTLPGALLDRSRRWLVGTEAKWRDESSSWVFPSGATVSFGYLESDRDVEQYQSAEFQFIGFDELTQFTEYQFRYMFSRKRKLIDVDIPTRIRSASNPGSIGHEWVKQRYLTEGLSQGRPFIPAKLADNPYLDQDDYEKSLANLDPLTRQRLLEGDWSASRAGNKFQREWFEIAESAPAEMRRARYWDLAATEPRQGKDPDWTCGCLMGRTGKGVGYILDIRRVRTTPLNVESLIRQTAQLDGPDVTIYMEQEPGSSGINTIDHYRREVLPQYAFYGVKSTGSKEVRANPLSSQAQAGNIRLVRGTWINEFLDEIEAFPGGTHDDQVDAASGAWLQLAGEAGTVELPENEARSALAGLRGKSF